MQLHFHNVENVELCEKCGNEKLKFNDEISEFIRVQKTLLHSDRVDKLYHFF